MLRIAFFVLAVTVYLCTVRCRCCSIRAIFNPATKEHIRLRHIKSHCNGSTACNSTNSTCGLSFHIPSMDRKLYIRLRLWRYIGCMYYIHWINIGAKQRTSQKSLRPKSDAIRRKGLVGHWHEDGETVSKPRNK